jgi:hypothetical protein
MPGDLGAVRKEVRDSFVLVQVEAEIWVCLLIQPPNNHQFQCQIYILIQGRRCHLEWGELEQARIRIVRLLEREVEHPRVSNWVGNTSSLP